MDSTTSALGWWARIKAWWNPPPVPNHVWIREPTRSIYLIDECGVALVVAMDVDSFPGYGWKVDVPGGACGVEPTREFAELAAVQAARDSGLFGWDG